MSTSTARVATAIRMLDSGRAGARAPVMVLVGVPRGAGEPRPARAAQGRSQIDVFTLELDLRPGARKQRDLRGVR